MAKGHGESDYVLFVDREAVGVIEAKKEGSTLTEVEWRASKYATRPAVRRVNHPACGADVVQNFPGELDTQSTRPGHNGGASWNRTSDLSIISAAL